MKTNNIDHPIGQTISWKFGLITREVYRVSEDLFEIHITSDGWAIAEVNKEQMIKLKVGKLKLSELNWK